VERVILVTKKEALEYMHEIGNTIAETVDLLEILVEEVDEAEFIHFSTHTRNGYAIDRLEETLEEILEFVRDIKTIEAKISKSNLK
jgi:uncharacterized membrane-anchored protein